MAVTSENDKVEFGARIPRKLFDEFREYFPQYGASTYFINTSLEEFMAGVRGDPSARERVRAAIEKMVRDNREDKEAVA